MRSPNKTETQRDMIYQLAMLGVSYEAMAKVMSELKTYQPESGYEWIRRDYVPRFRKYPGLLAKCAKSPLSSGKLRELYPL